MNEAFQIFWEKNQLFLSKKDLLIFIFFRSLDQLQKASEKREAMEKKLRAKLEDELMEFRQAQTGNTDPNLRPGDSIEEFRRKLSEAEEKVFKGVSVVETHIPV